MPPTSPSSAATRAWQSAHARLRGFLRYRRLTGEPVVVGGCERSGTTLLLSVLSAHPSLHAIPEESWAFASAGLAWGDPERPIRMERLYRHLGMGDLDPRSTRWCEKTPANVLHFGEILEHFEGRVRLIHIVRDGRDVISSRHPEKPDGLWMQPSRWVYTVGAGAAWVGHPNVLTIRYEDLIQDFDVTAKAICDHISEEVTPALEDWLDHAQVRQSVHIRGGTVSQLFAKSIGKFRQPDFPFGEHVDRLMADPEARDLLERFGYL